MLFIDNDVVRQVLTMKACIEAQEKAKEACINLAEWTERLVVAKQAALEEAG